MNIKILSLTLFQLAIATFVNPPSLLAQTDNCEATTLEAFFDCYGGTDAFSAHSINAVTTFIQAEDAINAGDYEQAQTLVNNLFRAYPKGSNVWWNVFNDPNGANLGTPHAYYGLRMIEDIVDYQLNNNTEIESKKAITKIVLVGCSEGVQPTTEAELRNGTGPFIRNTMDLNLRAEDYRIVRQSFDFFSKYVTAITKGQLEFEIEIIELPDLCMPVSVSNTTPYFATGSIAPVWEALSEEVKENTDWWWILYPSHVPEFPTFDDEAFITGGMGLDQKGGPAFIIDDKWLVRKPAHLGKGKYSDIERRVYLPQWLQHEFYHHLYRAYPELRLEVNGHDWFNRNFWASDFDGQFEADYYAETLHKRLQKECVPLTTKLITRTNDDIQQQLTLLSEEDLLGGYSLDQVLNPWHLGEIIKEGARYYWKNKADVRWEVFPKITEGKLETGTDTPYPGQDFFIELYQTIEGDYIPAISALKFQGESYNRRFNLINGSLPLEIFLDEYAKATADTPQPAGFITKESGMFFWTQTNEESWSLSPNLEEPSFILNSDSSSPGQKLQLILFPGECETYALGFEYLGAYYWKPKRDEQNKSPLRTNPIEDIELPENFGRFTINLSNVFEDPEGNELLYFATSQKTALISTETIGPQLILNGGTTGNTDILVMAVDANGGLAVADFEVKVGTIVSNDNFTEGEQPISISPNPAKDYILITGQLSDCQISLYSIDKSFQQEILIAGNEIRVDLSHLTAGVYMIQILEPKSGKTQVEKVVKY